MRIVIVPRMVAEKLTDMSKKKYGKIVCISIYSSKDVPADIKCAESTLSLCFDDVSWYDIPDTVPFSRDQARDILDFVKCHYDANILLIHCDAGVSRSPGVGVAISELFTDDKSLYKKFPYYNKFVYSIIMNEAYNILHGIDPELNYNHVF